MFALHQLNRRARHATEMNVDTTDLKTRPIEIVTSIKFTYLCDQRKTTDG